MKIIKARNNATGIEKQMIFNSIEEARIHNPFFNEFVELKTIKRENIEDHIINKQKGL